MQGSFTPDSAEKFYQLMQGEGYDVNPLSSSGERVDFSSQRASKEPEAMNIADFDESRGEYLDILDFTRCVKPNGEVYGTSGTCRKGTPQELDEEDESEAVKMLSKLIPKGETILGRYGKVYKS
jgi:hypothetical protein